MDKDTTVKAIRAVQAGLPRMSSDLPGVPWRTLPTAYTILESLITGEGRVPAFPKENEGAAVIAACELVLESALREVRRTRDASGGRDVFSRRKEGDPTAAAYLRITECLADVMYAHL